MRKNVVSLISSFGGITMTRCIECNIIINRNTLGIVDENTALVGIDDDDL
jgi:hypothetical protein